MREHPRCGPGDILEPQGLERDTRLLFQALHHGVVELPLAGEMPVDGALADSGALRGGADGQRTPVPDRALVRQLQARLDDALPGLGRALAAQAAVVPAALPRLPTPLAAPGQIDEAARVLRDGGEGVVLLIGHGALSEQGLALAHLAWNLPDEQDHRG